MINWDVTNNRHVAKLAICLALSCSVTAKELHPEFKKSFSPKQLASTQQVTTRSTNVESSNWNESTSPHSSYLKTTSTISSASVVPVSFYGDVKDIDDDFDPNFIDNTREDIMNSVEPISSSITEGESDEQHQQLPHSPVIFRYYGKRRSRTRASGSIPFILLGPNVDHWKTTGEHLAARGFSVIACERDPLEPEGVGESKSEKSGAKEASKWVVEDWWTGGGDEEGANLVSNVLQASRWTKAILVACDSEAVIAIQAAMRLAPDKIAGVVFCGDLTEIYSLLDISHPEYSLEGCFSIDAFLREKLPCPFAIAWDGEISKDKIPVQAPTEYDGSSSAECLNGNRCLVLGGGVAPHRRQAETFSWALTRFVEDKVATSIRISEKVKIVRRVRKDIKEKDLPAVPRRLKKALSFLSGDFFSTGSFVVYGRIVASALLYATILKVGIYQYGNFLDRMLRMKNRYDTVQSVRRQVFQTIRGFLVNYGYISLLFRRKQPSQSETETELAPTPESDEVTEEGEEEDVEECEGYGAEREHEEDKAAEGVAPGESYEPPDSNGADEKEEERRYQPLFFLDKVVASINVPSKETNA